MIVGVVGFVETCDVLVCLNGFDIVGWEYVGFVSFLYGVIYLIFINSLNIYDSIFIFERYFICISSYIVIYGTEDFLLVRREKNLLDL